MAESNASVGRCPPIEKFIEGRSIALIEAGETQSEPINLNAKTQSVVLFCKVFDKKGYVVRRRHRLSVKEDADAAIISIEKPIKQTIQVLYKIETDDDIIDDENWDDIEM